MCGVCVSQSAGVQFSAFHHILVLVHGHCAHLLQFNVTLFTQHLLVRTFSSQNLPPAGGPLFLLFLLFSLTKVKFHTSLVITTTVMFTTTNKHRCILLISFVKFITRLESSVFVNLITFPPALSLRLLVRSSCFNLLFLCIHQIKLLKMWILLTYVAIRFWLITHSFFLIISSSLHPSWSSWRPASVPFTPQKPW